MKHAVIISIIAVLAAMLLPMLLVTPSSPAPEAPAHLDKDISFTVKTESGIETVDMASYLPGVLAGEMPALFEEQALMAQAVAARTYILHRIEKGSTNHPEADICNDPACCKAYSSTEQLQENWGNNFDAYYAKISNAVTSTDGEYLTYAGNLIEAVFHSSSAGATEASGSIWNDRPYLVSVESPETEEDVPNYVTEVTYTADELEAKLTANYPEMTISGDASAWISDLETNASGRVQSVTVCGEKLTGAQMRSVFGLRSTSFTLSYADSQFTFTVTGYGHGVGMSQYGANVYAKQGWDYKEILAHYYPETQLTSEAG